MKKILLATNNQAKVDEIHRYFTDSSIELVTLKDMGITDIAPEDGATFEENALTKARFYMEKSGLPSLADDGGIEIDALNGKPGVASHRWVSIDKDDEDETLITEVYKQLDGVPPEKRGAQMHVVLAFILPDGRSFIRDGIIRGVVSDVPSQHRTPGFPFRSVFYIPQLKKFYDHSVMTESENEEYNHRKMALEKLKPIILTALQ